jgi:predicted alpha-1,2-mannosidase
MRKCINLAAVVMTAALGIMTAALARAGAEDSRFVNPFIGTDLVEHAFPGPAWPFGMVQLGPDTGGNKGLYLMSDWKWCAGYNYQDATILGFSHLHRSGMGVGDWGDVLIMPTVGALKIKPGDEARPGSGYRSAFRHETETARPGYYAVTLDDSGVRAELTVSPRAGLHRYTFPASDAAHILIDLARGLGDIPLGGRVRIVGNDTITGTRTSNGVIPFQKVHFCARFSRPFDSFGVWSNGVKMPGLRAADGARIGAFVNYRTREAEPVLIKVGISFTSEDEARQNLDHDLPGWDFDATAAAAHDAWASALGKITITPSPADDPALSASHRVIFFTALYHSLLFPARFNDADGAYAPAGNRPGRVKHTDVDYYSDYSIWDTFRAQMPLLMLLDPRRAGDMIQTLVTEYQDSGWLPTPNSFGNSHSEGMIGDAPAIIIADAHLKGITNFDLESAYSGLRKNATAPPRNIIPMIGAGRGRWANMAYQRRGYVPANWNAKPGNPLFIVPYAYNQGASRTLEYAYADFCLARLAQDLGRADDYELFRRRADNFRNVFDPATGFMRGKDSRGRWHDRRDFDPRAYYATYTEGNGWQWTWSVFHDVAGLIDLMGGREKFNAKLDEFFAGGEEVEAYKLFAVHIRGQIGQYAHGNEPSHHAAYLYDFSGQPWKTQAMARRIMDELYRDQPDGLAGNDDMGQMSAWYVFSSLGLYPFAPGIYVIGSPLFSRAEIALDNGAKIIIEADNVSSANQYIQSATLNGAPLNRPWLAHSELARGATLHFLMGPEPNRDWGSAPEAAPPSGAALLNLAPAR